MAERRCEELEAGAAKAPRVMRLLAGHGGREPLPTG